MYRFNLKGYAHLYRSLLRFIGMEARETKRLLYLLNTANLDSYRYRYPDRYVMESDPGLFAKHLDSAVRPYHTEVQLYKSLHCLRQNIDMGYIVEEQRQAVRQLMCIMRNLEYRFHKCFGIDIDDKQTIYAECAYDLIPDEDEEPNCCIFLDWLRGS